MRKLRKNELTFIKLPMLGPKLRSKRFGPNPVHQPGQNQTTEAHDEPYIFGFRIFHFLICSIGHLTFDSDM